MKLSRNRLRRVGAAILAVVMCLGPFPAAAQKMHTDGMQLPWFRSKAQIIARQACEDELPECRDSVRKQLATEKAITSMAPWAMLAFAIIGALLYARRQEILKERRRQDAAREHTRSSARAKEAKARPASDERDEKSGDTDDGFGFSHPADPPARRKR